jgi:pantetheine-phosphate adenylyltransferase
VRRAAFAGSFDPWTQGHSRIVQRGLEMFDEIVIIVADNQLKQYMFDAEERVAIVRASLETRFGPEEPRLRVIRMAEGYTADHAKALGCCAMLRGLRISDAAKTYDEVAHEEQLAGFGMARAGIPTCFVFTGLMVSSTRIRSFSAEEYRDSTLGSGLELGAVPIVNKRLEEVRDGARLRTEQVRHGMLPARVLDNPPTEPITGEEQF